MNRAIPGYYYGARRSCVRPSLAHGGQTQISKSTSRYCPATLCQQVRRIRRKMCAGRERRTPYALVLHHAAHAECQKRARRARVEPMERARVLRCRTLTHPLVGRVALLRELGELPSQRAAHAGRSEAVGSGLTGCPVLELEGRNDEISTFTRDPLTGGIFAGKSSQ